MTCVFGALYKYDRQLFYRGEHEITYLLKYKEQVCTLSSCNNGYILEFANSGTQIFDRFRLSVVGLDTTDLRVEQSLARLSNYETESSQEDEIKVLISRSGIVYDVHVRDIPPMWYAKLTFMSPDYDPYLEKSNPIVKFAGRGSFLEEDPKKVALLAKTQYFITAFFWKIRNFFRSDKKRRIPSGSELAI